MDKDDIIWRELEEATDEWEKVIRTDAIHRAVGKLILKYRPGQAELMHRVIKGGYNIIYRLEYKDGSSIIMRIPIQGQCALTEWASRAQPLNRVGIVPFPDEKVRYEVATMRYIAAHTTIPVPHIYHHAPAADNPTGLGPFIIMEYIQHQQNMSRVLLDPKHPTSEKPVLNPDISEDKLGYLYAQMANILLQLSTLEFPRIGSLVQNKDNNAISVEGRPLIQNMNDLVVHTNMPPSILPSKTYDSADEWYSALADMHMAQLAFQQNDVVEDEDDARDKYTARQLFRTLSSEKRLLSDLSQTDGGYRLFSEDFRPANVLLDKELRVVGVIDWEFAYAAPAPFAFDPPWWLLLEEPEYWPGGYQAWMQAYEPRFRLFLRVLEAEESKMQAANPARLASDTSQPNVENSRPSLSERMRESWERRTWMLNYASRKSWAFDFVWWKYLDERYLGPNENQDHEARLEFLSVAQRKTMEPFVSSKMEGQRNDEVATWTEKQAANRMAELLI